MEIVTMPECDLRVKLRKYVYDIIGCCQEVHAVKGPELTEYVYQECLEIAFEQENIPYKKEYSFHPDYKGVRLKSSLRVDFLVKEKVFVECKAIETLSNYERIQLTSYMRNAGIRIGILYNFAPVIAQCERYYYDPDNNTISYF